MTRPRAKKDAVRFSVSLDLQFYTKLVRIADSNDVSLAWTVRKAIAEFVERQEEIEQAELPLLQPPPRK